MCIVIRKPCLIPVALSTVLLFLPGCNLGHHITGGSLQPAREPRVMLWAWERPERLSFLNSSDIGVAYLAETIYLKQHQFVIRPRLKILKVNKQTYLEAVVRIESDREISWNPNEQELDHLASAIAVQAAKPEVKSLQIDFDAKESERGAYRQLLAVVRTKLPSDKALSMTALASWCLADRWIANAPVDEVVPMLFSMGAGRQDAFNFITSSRPGELSYFQKCVGLSINDQTSFDLLAQRTVMEKSRIYFFSSRPWDPLLVQQARSEVRKWQTTFAI